MRQRVRGEGWGWRAASRERKAKGKRKSASSLLPAPTKPENLTSRDITGTSIRLSWSEPENANGLIAGYRVYYMYSNYTDVKMHIPNKTISSDEPPSINFVLKELREYAFHARQRCPADYRGKGIIEPRRIRSGSPPHRERGEDTFPV